VGPGTAELIRTRLSQLEDSAGEDGEPLWDEVAAGWGFPVTPTHPLSTGEAFVEAAAGVISCWIGAHDTEADRLILGERLVRAREERLKLEELGRRLGLTRERVRQREKKLLDGLCDALLADDQSASPVQFSADSRTVIGRVGIDKGWAVAVNDRPGKVYDEVGPPVVVEVEVGLPPPPPVPAGPSSPPHPQKNPVAQMPAAAIKVEIRFQFIGCLRK